MIFIHYSLLKDHMASLKILEKRIKELKRGISDSISVATPEQYTQLKIILERLDGLEKSVSEINNSFYHLYDAGMVAKRQTARDVNHLSFAIQKLFL